MRRRLSMIAGGTVMTQALTMPQLNELKALLLARRADLAAQIASNRANLAPAENTAGSVSQDENGRLSNQTREVDTALTAMDTQELARIDRALEAMDEGEYGQCEDCGCHIPFERLKIEPMTQHCVQCKSRWEKAHPQAVRS
jgi:DnaK suppressor protein